MWGLNRNGQTGTNVKVRKATSLLLILPLPLPLPLQRLDQFKFSSSYCSHVWSQTSISPHLPPPSLLSCYVLPYYAILPCRVCPDLTCPVLCCLEGRECIGAASCGAGRTRQAPYTRSHMWPQPLRPCHQLWPCVCVGGRRVRQVSVCVCVYVSVCALCFVFFIALFSLFAVFLLTLYAALFSLHCIPPHWTGLDSHQSSRRSNGWRLPYPSQVSRWVGFLIHSMIIFFVPFNSGANNT